jgi:hypothetical protein
MHPGQSKTVILALATAIAIVLGVSVEGVDVRVEADKAFDFKPMRTWAWNTEGPGRVIMARTSSDDPEAAKKMVEPWIVDAVTTEIVRRGLQPAASAPDLIVTYYLLLTTNMTAQTLGQFLPATTAWGLPPFAPATQSLQMMNQGSLVLDLKAGSEVVWRGVAQAKISFEATDKKREALVREAIRDLLKRYPPKP